MQGTILHMPILQFIRPSAIIICVPITRNTTEYGALAQLVERGTPTSSPPTNAFPNKFGALAQLVERTNRTLSPSGDNPRTVIWRNCTKIACNIWGYSTVGSALHSHCRGHGFESR